ncbi:MAG: 50S ribosome-binding GTPase [Planctomycetes bacterium]|nr:50S ribosome-binding GTPase [Planctomycetota bacterium]
MWSADELIVAPATVPGNGARAIVRLAGDGLADLLQSLLSAMAWPRHGERPRVVRATLAADGLGRDWGQLPVEVLVWPGPAGPIGGPLAEVQLPASAPLVAAMVAEACRHGARLARGGEFTLRAFLAGRLDLVQAEAVLGVVDARSPEQLAAALDRLGGGAGAALAVARGELLDLLADIEASIDFADETTPDAVPAQPVWSEIAARLDRCFAAITGVAATLAGRDAAGGDLPRVVLVGRPNIGKSSLFNAVAGRDAALVADESGTTRDSIEARVRGGLGRDWLLVDLAGVDDAVAVRGDPIDVAARARAADEASRADVVVACRDAGAGRAAPVIEGVAPRIDVVTRCDRVAADGDATTEIVTSVVAGTGIGQLKDAIDAAVAGLPAAESATLRMRVAAVAAGAAVAEARRAVEQAIAGRGVDEAVVAGSLRTAAESLAEVTGDAIGTDLLDRIFSRHCIGK